MSHSPSVSLKPSSDKALRRIALLVNTAALALLCFGLARMTWQMLSPSQSSAPAVKPSGALDDAGRGALRAAALFGHSTVKTQAAAPMSGLVLSGVVAAGRNSLALISVEGAAAEPFFLGDEVAKGMTLHAAAADHVLIRRGAAIDRLELSGRDENQSAVAATVTTPNSAVEQIAPNRFALSRGLAEAQLRSPEFLRQAMMVPQADGGFRVREITAGSLAEKLGLRSGDVIRSVNGSPVNNLEDAMQLYRRLGNAGQVQIEISRGGKVETLEYTIR